MLAGDDLWGSADDQWGNNNRGRQEQPMPSRRAGRGRQQGRDGTMHIISLSNIPNIDPKDWRMIGNCDITSLCSTVRFIYLEMAT